MKDLGTSGIHSALLSKGHPLDSITLYPIPFFLQMADTEVLSCYNGVLNSGSEETEVQ